MGVDFFIMKNEYISRESIFVFSRSPVILYQKLQYSLFMANTFFITTPIYYSNGIPHIGHAYSSLIADTIARYHCLKHEDVRFSTGVDENSQKVVESADSQ